MADDSFESALLRRIDNYRQAESHVDARLLEVEAERDRLRARRIAGETLYEAEFGDLPSRGRATETGSEPNLPSAEGPLTGLSWEDAIERVLREAGKPLHVRQVWELLAAGGFRTEARDPTRSIVAIAVRSPRLVKAGRNVYGLVGVAERRAEEG